MEVLASLLIFAKWIESTFLFPLLLKLFLEPLFVLIFLLLLLILSLLFFFFFFFDFNFLDRWLFHFLYWLTPFYFWFHLFGMLHLKLFVKYFEPFDCAEHNISLLGVIKHFSKIIIEFLFIGLPTEIGFSQTSKISK